MSISSPSAKSVTVAATAIIATGILLHKRNAISTYYTSRRGINGLLRLIWEGDFLPPHLRKSMEELDKVEGSMSKSGEQLEQIEILIERARLESVDGSNNTSAEDDEQLNSEEAKKRFFQQNPELRTRIAIFSNKLDTLAAMIDSTKSHSDDEVKRRKKYLSNCIVALMTELDRMVASLNLGVTL